MRLRQLIESESPNDQIMIRLMQDVADTVREGYNGDYLGYWLTPGGLLQVSQYTHSDAAHRSYSLESVDPQVAQRFVAANNPLEEGDYFYDPAFVNVSDEDIAYLHGWVRVLVFIKHKTNQISLNLEFVDWAVDRGPLRTVYDMLRDRDFSQLFSRVYMDIEKSANIFARVYENGTPLEMDSTMVAAQTVRKFLQ